MHPGYSTDIVIFGGGVAGLWLLNRLTGAGYRAILLENHRLGGGQSIHSQGIIHGGLKYALHGAISGASRATADMPRRWRECIKGRGEVDLSACELLSPGFLLWAGEGVGAGMKAFLGSKAVAGKAEAAPPIEVPPFLRGRGAVYRLPDFVVDPESLIKALAAPHTGRIHQIESSDARDGAEAVRFERATAKRRLHLAKGEGFVSLSAQRYIFCAGAGNERLIEQAGLSLPRCQRRPLKMLAVSGAPLPQVFLHMLGPGLSATPRLTITSHRNAQNPDAPVWYLGGQLAEEGTGRADAAQIAAARRMLAELMPELRMSKLEWRCFAIDRAEPASPGGRRPDNAVIVAEEDVITAWPTKLTLAPVLADLVLRKLREDGIDPAATAQSPAMADPALAKLRRPPAVARPFWS